MTMYRLEMKPHVETDAQYEKRKMDLLESESSTSQRNYNYIQRKINEFKDGVTDAMIHGTKDEKKSHHYYNQGYDFGVVLYNKQQEDSE